MSDLKKQLIVFIAAAIFLLIVAMLISCLFLSWLTNSNPVDQSVLEGHIPLEKKLEMAAHLGETFVIVHAFVDLCLLLFGLYAFLHERRQIRESLFQSAFFSQLSLFNVYVCNLREGPLRGTQCFAEWEKRLGEDDKKDRKYYWGRMSSYFLQVHGLLQMIDLSEISDKMKLRYAQILEAHFSDSDDKVQQCVCKSGLGVEIVTLGQNIQKLRKELSEINQS